MADPCTTSCKSSCHQGRLPCPHRPADVAAMREMGVDLRPLPQREPEPTHIPRAVALRLLALALAAAGIGVAAALWS